QRATRDVVVVGFIGLTEVRGVRVRDRAFRAHPVERRARVEAAGEGDPDALTDRNLLKDAGHSSILTCRLWAFGSGLWALGFGLWALGSGLWEEHSNVREAGQR